MCWVKSVLARESALIEQLAEEVSKSKMKVEVNPGSVTGTPTT